VPDDTARKATAAPVSLSRALVYRLIRSNIRNLIETRPEAGACPVPACPQSTVRDLIAHLVGNCLLAEGTLRGLAPRTRLLPRRLTLSDLLTRWERSAQPVERHLMRASAERAGSVLVMDAFTHEFDLALALGASLPAEHPALPDAFAVAVAGFGGALSWRSLPPLRLRIAQLCRNAGDGEPVAVVTGTSIDVYRSLVGRRTVQQIRQLDWSAEPGPWLPAFAWGPFRPPGAPVE
jgi:uncharacterized protein (TIGR03083 family)